MNNKGTDLIYIMDDYKSSWNAWKIVWMAIMYKSKRVHIGWLNDNKWLMKNIDRRTMNCRRMNDSRTTGCIMDDKPTTTNKITNDENKRQIMDGW